MSLLSNLWDSERVLSASARMRTVSYVESGRETRDRESRSSIWMSVVVRSCAATILSNFSGWEDRDGGESKSDLVVDMLSAGLDCGVAKSEVVSRITEGAITTTKRQLDVGDVRYPNVLWEQFNVK